jgi:hypothetical protein
VDQKTLVRVFMAGEGEVLLEAVGVHLGRLSTPAMEGKIGNQTLIWSPIAVAER